MTIEEAEKIIHAYGRHLEQYSKILMPLFLVQIPESFLPYSKRIIFEALSLSIEHCRKLGDKKMEENLKSTSVWLDSYIDDEIAFDEFAKRLNKKEFRKILIQLIKKNSNR